MKYTTKAGKFFTEQERDRIKAATRDVEVRTAGEVAVMIVDSSSQYAEAGVIGGMLSGSLLSLIVAVLFFHASVWIYVPLSFMLFFPFRVLFMRMPAAKAAFAGIKRKEQAVRERALRAFYEKGLYRTKKNTGVLFFLSLLERKVWVLADKGINEKMRQEVLNKFAGDVSLGIKTGYACDALCKAIKEAGDLLALYFPKTKGDINELSDEVMTE